MNADQIQVAQGSLERCNASPRFCATFYQLFLESSPAVPPMFAATDFEQQCKQLRHGLGLLLAYARHDNPVLLERVARRHARGDLNAAPDLYPLFVDSLLKAVALHDPNYGPELDHAWRNAIAPGIRYMTSLY